MSFSRLMIPEDKQTVKFVTDEQPNLILIIITSQTYLSKSKEL